MYIFSVSFSSYPIIMMNSIYRVYVSGILGSFVSCYSQSENERSKTFVMGKICANFNCSVSMLINDSKRKELPNQFWWIASRASLKKKGQNQSRESVTFSFLNPKWRGNPQKHYITDIDIYEIFHGKIMFLGKASALPGKSISVYLHLDYIFAK